MVDLIDRTCLYFINRCLCSEILGLKGREDCPFLQFPTCKKTRPTRKKKGLNSKKNRSNSYFLALYIKLTIHACTCIYACIYN